ncbi:ribose/xylose/arabinose/galactoside ABC-type transport system permease subunit [Actinomadura luteofluorescens]|uniref:Ribose/xylose/arabinose/galactoside ABC-type transport system permease subunit n=1 Tax=Actinomadura luteofluorescens TaxID=46163 RepID=A0A7Y9EBS2_9ACTN|nr:ABC transporter permease [Actinomadura luteofluorescens]NYD44846.1 ribose/xylose/arabinose/galactoside ABC-type transport system permease subunit [Actinomadura luteofluorescens]
MTSTVTSLASPSRLSSAAAAARRLRAVWMLLLVGIILTIASPVFLTHNNLMNVGLATSVAALLAVGQSYVIILAEIDLSVGAALGFTAVVTAQTLRDHGLVAGVGAGVATGAAIGLVNGLLVTKTRMPSFIATLATMSVLSGLSLQLTKGNPVAVTDYDFQGIGQSRIAGVPVPVVIMLVVFAVFGYLLARTRFGRYVYATGDNTEAARLSGVRTDRVKILAFVISGVLAALAGFILTARLSTAEPTAGTGLELEAIAAVIIGGTSLAGGRGTLLGTLVGALVLGVIDNGMNLLDVSPFLQNVVKGLVILLAVFLDRNIDVLRSLIPKRTDKTTQGGPSHRSGAAAKTP